MERIGIRTPLRKSTMPPQFHKTSCLQRPATAWRWCWARGGSRWRNQRWQRSLRACTSSSLPLVHAKDIGNLYHSTCASAEYLYIKRFKENLYDNHYLECSPQLMVDHLVVPIGEHVSCESAAYWYFCGKLVAEKNDFYSGGGANLKSSIYTNLVVSWTTPTPKQEL